MDRRYLVFKPYVHNAPTYGNHRAEFRGSGHSVQVAGRTLGPVNTCFAPALRNREGRGRGFNRNEARAARQSKLCKGRVTMGWVKFRPRPSRLRNAGAKQVLTGPRSIETTAVPRILLFSAQSVAGANLQG